MTANAVEMKTDTIGVNKIGLVMFWVGAVIVFTGSWLVQWWVFPIWKNSPPEQFAGTMLAVEGPVYMLIALSTHRNCKSETFTFSEGFYSFDATCLTLEHHFYFLLCIHV